MKNFLFIFLTCVTICFSQALMAQTAETKKKDPNRFDEKAARTLAKAKGIKDSDINGYVQYLKNDFITKRALAKQSHLHSPYEPAGTPGIQETVIYLEPNKPMSLGCPNMGFEQYNFNGWTGGTGTVSAGPIGGSPNYNASGAVIVSPAGNNVPTTNTANYHTIMSLPPVQPNLTGISGYDQNSCKSVGSQTISEIPVVSPYSFDPVSVRMNGEAANYTACRLKYITTASATNQRLSFSYAVVLQDGAHPAEESPYFRVEVRNETTGAILPGCTSYTFNPVSSLPSDSLKTSVTGPSSGLNSIHYRKWQYFSVDLSSLPAGTNVSLNFEVGSCAQGGHWGYAYVDAECGGIGTPYANMCSGSNFATLVAPTGFNSYQWYDPSGTLIPGATNDTLFAGPVPPVSPGMTYSVNMISPGGCPISQTVTIGFTTVNIINLNATSSCAGGHSGTADVQANGSNGIYTYSWTATSGTNTGVCVSTSQTATGLAPGTYSVLVSSTTCGQASANLSVGVSPPFFATQSKPFCGNATSIPLAGGTNYVWYHNNAVIPAPIGINDTLFISAALSGDVYTVVYNNSLGCRDSLEYTLSSVTGGNSYFSNTANVCPGNTNGSTVINLNTPFPPQYNYFVTGPAAGNVIANTTSSASTLTLTSLAPGTYTAVVYDGLCLYNNTVTVGVIQTNFTVTPTNTVLCFPSPGTLELDFGSSTPLNCGIDPILCSGGSPTTLFSTGTFTQNGSTDYPTPYGNWYTNGRSQFLVRKSELNAAGITGGRISSLAFNILNLNTSALNYPDFSIKMGCTSLATLPNASFSSPQPFVTGLQTVYSNASQPISLGWVTHNFSQSYLWDGNSNIIIEVCFAFPNPSGFGNYTQNVSVQLKQMSYIANMFHVEDINPVCGGSQPADNANGGLLTNGENMLPNMKFGFCQYAPPASDYTVSVSPNGTITANYGDSIVVAPTSPIPPPGGNITYTVTVKNPIGGCVATRTVEVIYPPLTTTIISTPTNTTLCEGGSATLSSTGAYNYNWYYQQGSGGPLVSIATAPSITVTPPAIGTNTYVVIGNSFCPSSIADTNTVTVNVTPIANLIITPLPDVNKCLNMPFVFNPAVGSITPGNAATPFTYSWTTLPGNSPAPGTNSTSSYTTNSNTTTTLVVTVNGVCSNSTSDTVVVKNFADDLGITISNSITTCPNQLLNLNSAVTGGHAIYNYTWTVNSVPVANTANLNYTSPSTGGAYNVMVTVMDSCSYQKTDTKVINVLPNTLNIAIVDSISLCGNTAFTLTSVSGGGYPSYTYNWYLLPSNNSISNTTSFTYITPEAEGVYTVQVVMKDSCGYQQSDYQLINILPPCQVEIPNVITPNGDLANEYFKIKNIEYHPNTKITIFDRWGLKIYENNNYNNEWKAEGLNDGTYFYVVDVPNDKKYSGFVTVFKGK